MTGRNIIIFGASRGLGDAIARGVPKDGDTVFLVSRSKPLIMDKETSFKKSWIAVDLSDLAHLSSICKEIGDGKIDLFIYNAGIWEEDVFEKVTDESIKTIIDVNLTAFLIIVKHFLPNLRESLKARVILIGSTAGLENEGAQGVAYVASKFGMRGAAHSLREYLRKDGIGVSIINPGGMAVDVSFDDGVGVAIQKYNAERIPVKDMVDTIDYIYDLSIASCPKEIVLPAIMDKDA